MKIIVKFLLTRRKHRVNIKVKICYKVFRVFNKTARNYSRNYSRNYTRNYSRKYKHINNNMLGDCLKKAEKNILNINLIFIIR